MTATAPPLPPSRPKVVAAVLVILHGLQALGLLPWLFMAGMAVMAFDAPGSTGNWRIWFFVLLLWSYPLWIAVAGIGAWWCFFRGRNVPALALAVLFSLPMPLFLLFIMLS